MFIPATGYKEQYEREETNTNPIRWMIPVVASRLSSAIIVCVLFHLASKSFYHLFVRREEKKEIQPRFHMHILR